MGSKSFTRATLSSGRETARNTTDHRRSLQRESREAWLREVLQQRREQEEKALRTREAVKAIILDEVFLTLHEVARLLALSDSSVRRILDQEPGVLVIKAPGAKRALMRVPVSVVERIISAGTISSCINGVGCTKWWGE
jgi:hypothetical protein